MRTWNYRIIELATSLHDPLGAVDVYRAIHEVHYEDGVPIAYGEKPAIIGWDASEGDGAPFEILDLIRAALAQPALAAQDFGANGINPKAPENLPMQEAELLPDGSRDVRELKGMFGPELKVVKIEDMKIGVIADVSIQRK
jgi:hypothetical protein